MYADAFEHLETTAFGKQARHSRRSHVMSSSSCHHVVSSSSCHHLTCAAQVELWREDKMSMAGTPRDAATPRTPGGGKEGWNELAGAAADDAVRPRPTVVGCGRVSLLTILDTWHSKTVRHHVPPCPALPRPAPPCRARRPPCSRDRARR
jgi:hypothetical protein